MTFVEMTAEDAAKIAEWRYSPPYHIYDFGEDDIPELTGGSYLVCRDENEVAGEPSGFACFGVSARIPTVEENVYTSPALDIGLGMCPDLCGKGGGRDFFAEVVGIAEKRAGGIPLRLTVAAFNARAQKVYSRAGFVEAAQVTHRSSGEIFIVMLRK